MVAKLILSLAVSALMSECSSVVVMADASTALDDALRASRYYMNHTTEPYSCSWEHSTFMLGVIELYKSTNSPALLEYSKAWARNYNYQLCTEKTHKPHPFGIKDANNQLCGATYIELYNLGGKTNANEIEATKQEFDAEIADPTMTGSWSWVDALFMAMNTYARLGKTTGDKKYFDKMFANFNASALAGPDQKTTYHFWSDKYNLFYRDDRFLNTNVFWGRGNGWAMGALVAAIENSPPSDPHRAVYIDLFKKQAASLKAIQSKDGCWRSSLLNVTGYPSPETTGSSCFTYGIAYGINNNILDSATYLPVAEQAWTCLSQTALQPSGLFGYCQPVGGSPEHNISPNSTSDFCVGQFLLAATQIAKLAPAMA